MSKLDEIRRDLRTIHQHQSESAAEQMADTLVDHATFLLAEVDRLTEACPFGLEGHVLCDCATQVREQVKRIQETIRPTGNPMDTLAEFRKLTALLNKETP